MTPEVDQAIVEDIRNLHQNGNSVSEIDQKLHLTEPAIQHVIDHGKPPVPQPQWKPND